MPGGNCAIAACAHFSSCHRLHRRDCRDCGSLPRLVRIGVLNDQSGLYADWRTGFGRSRPHDLAVRCSASRSRPCSPITRINPMSARLSRGNGSISARSIWRSVSTTPPALAVEQLAAERNKIAIAGAVGSMAFTGKSRTANEASWIYDSYALTTSLAKANRRRRTRHLVLHHGRLCVGHSLEADARRRRAGRRRQGARERAITPLIRRISARTRCRRRRRAEGHRLRQWRRRHGQRHQQATGSGSTKNETTVALPAIISDVHSMEL